MTTNRNKCSDQRIDHVPNPALAVDTEVNALPTPHTGDVNQVSPVTRAIEATPEPYEGQIREFHKDDEVNRDVEQVKDHGRMDPDDRTGPPRKAC